MKKFLIILITALSLVWGTKTAQADTLYLETPRSQFHVLDGGEGAAAFLTKWEKENPDKKVVCISVNVNTSVNEILGFWITFEYRQKN
jgi:ABC-type glycerol-3-phosphate transport system substrate-binding protein